MSVQGVKKLTAALDLRRMKTVAGFRQGLMKAGLFLQRESQKIVPIKTSFLKASANTRMEGHGAKSVVTVSYSTEYAIYVHEDLEARHKPGKSAKFLEKPLHEKQNLMAEIIVEEVKKGL